MQIKKPVKELTEKPSESDLTYAVVSEKLQTDPTNGYTILGLMVECFKVKQSDIENKPFKDWKTGLPSLYTRVRLSCEKLTKQGLAGKTIKDRANYYYWLNNKKLMKALMEKPIEV